MEMPGWGPGVVEEDEKTVGTRIQVDGQVIVVSETPEDILEEEQKAQESSSGFVQLTQVNRDKANEPVWVRLTEMKIFRHAHPDHQQMNSGILESREATGNES
jgi:hypothetical protein